MKRKIDWSAVYNWLSMFAISGLLFLTLSYPFWKILLINLCCNMLWATLLETIRSIKNET
jgi:hypothetical protein